MSGRRRSVAGTSPAGRFWGAAAWDWSRLVEPCMIPVYYAVFRVVGIAPDTRLLDAGCGAGLALWIAGARGAALSGLDASSALLRLASHRLPTADLRQGDLTRLPYPDGAFTAVTAFDSVPYAANPLQVLRELRRVATAGAPVAVVTLADPERCQARRMLAAIGAMLPPGLPGTGGPFALSRPGTLVDLVRTAGMVPQRMGSVPVGAHSGCYRARQLPPVGRRIPAGERVPLPHCDPREVITLNTRDQAGVPR